MPKLRFRFSNPFPIKGKASVVWGSDFACYKYSAIDYYKQDQDPF
jgi:hypothetical protein